MKVADQGLTLYADAFGIPRKVSVPFIKSFLKWIECSGEEWTVSRMKAIKLDFVRLKAGLEPVHNWISFSNGSFKGSIKGLQTWCSFSIRRDGLKPFNSYRFTPPVYPHLLHHLRNESSLMAFRKRIVQFLSLFPPWSVLRPIIWVSTSLIFRYHDLWHWSSSQI